MDARKLAMASKVLSSEDVRPEGFRWLKLSKIKWQDPTGRTRLWESAERTTRSAGGVDGVAVVARVLPRALAPARIVIIKQYRPPIGSYCLELPAGLIDAGESAGEAALRELAEETGYSGRLVGSTPVCSSDPGMSNANMQVALVEVDLGTPENAAARAAPEDGEFIEVELAPWEGLLEWLLERQQREGAGIDARLLAYALGLHHGAPPAAGSGNGRRQDGSGFGSPVTQMLDAPPAEGEAGAAGRARRGGDGVVRALAKAAGDGKFAAGMAVAALLSMLLHRR